MTAVKILLPIQDRKELLGARIDLYEILVSWRNAIAGCADLSSLLLWMLWGLW